MGRRTAILQARTLYVLAGLYVVLLLNSALLFALDYDLVGFAYRGSLVFHLVAGTLCLPPLLLFLVPHLWRMPHRQNRVGALVGAVAAGALTTTLVTGGLLYVERMAVMKPLVLGVHVASVVLTVLSVTAHWLLRRPGVSHFFALPTRSLLSKTGWFRHAYSRTLQFSVVGLLLAVVLLAPPAGTKQAYAEEEMLPGEARTADGRYLHSRSLLGSRSCGAEGCHPDVTEQWEQSAHHFSSFNNPYYRKSVEVMLADNPQAKTRWCASCHDPVLLMAGDLGPDDPNFMDRHDHARAGITCLACHAVVDVPDQTGNGNYVLEDPGYQALGEVAGGTSADLRRLLIETKPEPHGSSLLSGALTGDAFCTSCHKVAIPPTVNDYRWKRGQNHYDAWRNSSFSGRHPRSFYRRDGETCVSCHMPKVPSADQGSDEEGIRSHRFAAANTALPYLNGHADQLRAVTQNLQNDIAAVDVFEVIVNGKRYGPEAAFPVLKGGDEVEVTVLITNKNVGHALPSGTNDSNEWWVAVDIASSSSTPHLRSGALLADRTVDQDAHFLGAILIDEEARRIDRRNVHEWYATVHNGAVPSGQSRLVRYRGVLPIGTSADRITVALRARKFRQDLNAITFADGGRLLTPEQLTGIEAFIKGTKIPELPVVTVTETTRVAERAYAPGAPAWKRWNNFGIGLLAEEEFPAAGRAFARVEALRPEQSDGRLNRARALLLEGAIEPAGELLESLPETPKTAYFSGLAHYERGDYDAAKLAWETVIERYPEDLVTLSELGQLAYLQGEYDRAAGYLSRAAAIDPEDYTVLYRSMLLAAARGDSTASTLRQQYEYHKPNEAEQSAVATYLKAHPRTQREVQHVHYHRLLPGGGAGAKEETK